MQVKINGDKRAMVTILTTIVGFAMQRKPFRDYSSPLRAEAKKASKFS